jgi:hypothetical protein
MNKPALLIASKSNTNYFKVGSYVQSNPSRGDKPDAYGEVWVYNATVKHTPPLVRGL